MTAARTHVVLDTNVCLDLLLFGDPRAARLSAALRERRVVAVTNTACRDEWRQVLAYPQLRLDPARQDALLAAFDALAQAWPDDAPVPDAPPLPRCADPDDQKFLQLALAANARWLISRDQAVLALRRRVQRAGLFEILEPQEWELRDA